MAGENGGQKKRTLRRAIFFWLIYLLVVSALFGLENIQELLESIPAASGMADALAHFSSRYQRLALTPRPLEAHYTALVNIDPALEKPSPGPCALRALVAELLPKVASTGPALITVDIGFAKDRPGESCGEGTPETVALRAAIESAAASTPLVLGLRGKTVSHMFDREERELRQRGFAENEILFLAPIEVKSANVHFGSDFPNRDVGKVPILWYGTEAATGKPGQEKSLALVTAETYQASFPKGNARFRELERGDSHPFAAFLETDDFAVVEASELLAGAGDHARDALHGRVVVMGLNNNDDLWGTPVGKVPGYVLHANYIEALLDDRVYRPLKLVWRFVLSFVWFFVFELPFWLHGLSVRALAISCIASGLVLFLASYVASVNFGLYVGLFPPSILLIGARFVHNLGERALGEPALGE